MLKRLILLFVDRRSCSAIAGALMLLAVPQLFAEESCDCSCEAYTRMMELVDEVRAAAESGNFQKTPAEFQQLSACAGECARQWAQCANPEAEDVFRKADSVTEQQANPEKQESSGLPKDQLTPAYLEGIWCSVYGGQEVTQWQFYEDGSYQVGIPAGNGFTFAGVGPKSLEEFHGRFEKLIKLEPDTFSTQHSDSVKRKNVFTRGKCK